MSSYNVVLGSTGFSSKDALTAGAALKYLQGVELQAEFNAISTAVNSKIDSALINAVSGVAGLDTSSRISAAQMPYGYASSLASALGFNIGASGATTLAAPTSGNSLTIAQFAGANQLALTGSTSGTLSIGTAAAAGTWTLTLPATAGAASSLLQSNGSGVTSWVTALTLTGGASVALTVNQNSGALGIVSQATAGSVASIGVAGNGNVYGTSSFDMFQNAGNAAFLVNRASGGTLSFGTNAATGMLTLASAGNFTVAAPTSGVAVTIRAFTGTHSTQIADSANTLYNAGYLESPVLIKSTPYTAVLEDSGKTLYYNGTGAATFTIPGNATVAYPIGSILTFVNDATGATNMTIAITSDTLALSPGGTTGSRTLAQFGRATAHKVTNSRWIISGAGLT